MRPRAIAISHVRFQDPAQMPFVYDDDVIQTFSTNASDKAFRIAVGSRCQLYRMTMRSNAICERWIGSARRECLDFMIPINETHIKQALTCWVKHYNRGPYYPISLC